MQSRRSSGSGGKKAIWPERFQRNTARPFLGGGFSPPIWKICTSQIGSFLQVGVKIKHVWNHNLECVFETNFLALENQCLEDEFTFGKAYFAEQKVSFREGKYFYNKNDKFYYLFSRTPNLTKGMIFLCKYDIFCTPLQVLIWENRWAKQLAIHGFSLQKS